MEGAAGFKYSPGMDAEEFKIRARPGNRADLRRERERRAGISPFAHAPPGGGGHLLAGWRARLGRLLQAPRGGGLAHGGSGGPLLVGGAGSGRILSRKTLLALDGFLRARGTLALVAATAVLAGGINIAGVMRSKAEASRPGSAFLSSSGLGRLAEWNGRFRQSPDSLALLRSANHGVDGARPPLEEALDAAKKVGQPENGMGRAPDTDAGAMLAGFQKGLRGPGAQSDGRRARLERISLGPPAGTSAAFGSGTAAHSPAALRAAAVGGRGAVPLRSSPSRSVATRPVRGGLGRGAGPAGGGAYRQLLAANGLSRAAARNSEEPARYLAQKAFDGGAIGPGGSPIDGAGASLGGAGPGSGTQNASRIVGGNSGGPIQSPGGGTSTKKKCYYKPTDDPSQPYQCVDECPAGWTVTSDWPNEGDLGCNQCAKPPCKEDKIKEKDATPYKKWITIASMLLLVASVLLTVAYFLRNGPSAAWAKWLGYAAAALGVAAAGIGAYLMAGYGQYLQGAIFVAGGGMIAYLGFTLDAKAAKAGPVVKALADSKNADAQGKLKPQLKGDRWWEPEVKPSPPRDNSLPSPFF